MTEYTELIKRLRDLPHLLFVQLGQHENVVYQAADAIEELLQVVNHYEEESKGWWLAACEAKEEIQKLQANYEEAYSKGLLEGGIAQRAEDEKWLSQYNPMEDGKK